ncbi:MAG TPA: hypothetical protein DDW52_21220 [Planctomycetaceae bacterium]|nr:hypothetical protein [Planctomycetaceae bacterium]
MPIVPFSTTRSLCWTIAVLLTVCVADVRSDDSPEKHTSSPEHSQKPSLEQLKIQGANESRYRSSNQTSHSSKLEESAQTDLVKYNEVIGPLLVHHCSDCHSGSNPEGNFDLESLDPDLISGGDVEWWNEVFAVVTNGEMPPPDVSELDATGRREIVSWLSVELQRASIARRRLGGQPTLRRLTRYEFNYALQDLVGLPWDFAKDLPPEARSAEGFQNSAADLRLSVTQFETYLRAANAALHRATVDGERPITLDWNIPMQAAARKQWQKLDRDIAKLEKQLKDDPEKLKQRLEQLRRVPKTAHFIDLDSGKVAKAAWSYHGAQYAFAPTKGSNTNDSNADDGTDSTNNCVAVVPSGRNSHLIIELGNQLPDQGTLRVTAHVSKTTTAAPSLQLYFGWRASNEGRALIRVSKADKLITAAPDAPQTVQWEVPLGEIYPRNSVRTTSPMGATPSPSEYIRFVNSSASEATLQIHHVHVEAPVYDVWPPESHQRIFASKTLSGSSNQSAQDADSVRAVIKSFMHKAWRRSIAPEEVESKVKLYNKMLAECDTPERAVVEVLATVLASPQFLYVGATGHPEEPSQQDSFEIASRLSFWLWCSLPDEQLMQLAESGQLTAPEVLREQVGRMLMDPKAERFVQHFVHQWLNMQLLDFENFHQIASFDPLLKEAMQREPVELFAELLKTDASVLDFVHCDYAMLNERLAKHYGIGGVTGNHFRRVDFKDSDSRRGGLLTQAGFLAMNSDYPDSHPLKRAVWILECFMGDPPPPPPPAVPQIDVADPRIAEMTLKERIEDHRNHAACMSCHIKIDPWGIAFENYDALGRWRTQLDGELIDASSELYNGKRLEGIDGLKRHLLAEQQDKFVKSMVSKLTNYALGRPLSFADQAQIDEITSRVRQRGDGLQTLIEEIAVSELFASP